VFSKWGGGVSKSLCEDLPIEVQKKKSRGRFENYFEKVIASDKLTAALQRIISIFESNNIELIGVKFPLSEVYFEILRNKSYHADSLFLSNNLEVLDYENLMVERDSLFRNMDHLDKEGGEIFTDILFDSFENKL
jgi:hypothetical protein